MERLGELLDFVKNDANQQKGEIVLVVAGATDTEQEVQDYDTWLLRIAQELPPKKAAAVVADVLGLKKSAVYDRLLALQNA